MDAHSPLPFAPPDKQSRQPAGLRPARQSSIRCALYFAALTACMLLVAFFGFVRVVSEPRALSVGDVMSARLGALREAYVMLPAHERLDYLQEVARASGDSLALDDPGRWGLLEPDNTLSQAAVHQIRTLLPDAQVAFSGGEHPQVWFALPADDGGLHWIRVPVSPFPGDRLSMAAAYLAALALVVTLGMLYLGWRSRHEIRDAGRALGVLGARVDPGAHAVDTGSPAAPLPLPPGHSLDGLVAAMSRRLAQMRQERGQGLQQAATDLRDALTPWTQCRQVLGRDARACTMVMQLERVADQFEGFAHDWAAERPVPADLGAVVERVVGRESPGVTLALAPLPPLLLRPQAMGELLSQLIGNALSHGGGRVVVTAAQEGQDLVLRVLDRGDSLDGEAAALIGRPFFRGDAGRGQGVRAGLGVAIAQLIAQLHGGRLEVERRIGGGLVVALRLPLVQAEAPAREGGRRADGTGSRRPAWVGVLGDVLLLMALFAGAIALSFNIFSQVVVPAYIDSAVNMMAAEIESIGAGHAALPPPLRPAYLHALGRYSEGRVRVANPAGFELGDARLPTFRTFIERLRARLPGVSILVTPWPGSVLWIALPGDGDTTTWLAMRGRPYAPGMLPAFASLAVLLVACASWLVLRAHRRLAQGVAQSCVSSQGQDAAWGESDSMERRMQELRHRFDQVSEGLAHAKDEQEVLLHHLTRDLRDHLEALGDAGRRLSLDTVPLEGIARAVERLDQLARPAPGVRP